MKCCMVSSSSLHNGHNLETWNWLNFALTLWSTYDPHVSFTWAYAFNRLFELCLQCVQIGCTFPGAYNALFRNFNVDFVSASWVISFFQCSFTCRLTIIFHASFSGGLSSNSCAVGRPYLFSQAGSYKPREVNATSPINILSELLLFKIQYGSLSESLTARYLDVLSRFLEKLRMFHQLQSRPYGLTDKVHLYNAARGMFCFDRGVGIG